MRTKDYRVCAVEGGDQVGKGDGTEKIAEALSKHLSVTKISFPAYSFPIGASIRHMLKNGLEEVFKDSEITDEEEFETRMALYALNRLEMANALLDERYLNKFLLFDRSPFSNALTIAYGLKGSGKISEEELHKYVKKGFEYDRYIIERFGLDSCVIEFFDSSNKEWKGSRSGGDDQYENAGVQAVVGKVYDIFAKKVGNGWLKIATKNDSGWREREDIREDSLEFIYSKFPEIEKEMCLEKSIEIIEVEDVCRELYQGSVVSNGLKEELRRALEGNNKAKIYEASLKIADEIVKTCSEVVWRNDEIRDAFKEIIKQAPYCISVIAYFMGQEYADLLKESYE